MKTQYYHKSPIQQHLSNSFDVSYYLPHTYKEKEILSEKTKKIMNELKMSYNESVEEKLERQYKSFFQFGGNNIEDDTNIILKQAGFDIIEPIEKKLNDQLISFFTLEKPLHLNNMHGGSYKKIKQIYFKLKRHIMSNQLQNQ